MPEQRALESRRRIASLKDISRRTWTIPLWTFTALYVFLGLGQALEDFAVKVSTRPKPFTGIVYTQAPATFSKDRMAVILHDSAEPTEVNDAVLAVEKTRDYRWLWSLQTRKAVSLVPERTAVAVINYPSERELFYGDPFYRIRVIEGDYAGSTGRIAHSSLSRDLASVGRAKWDKVRKAGWIGRGLRYVDSLSASTQSQ